MPPGNDRTIAPSPVSDGPTARITSLETQATALRDGPMIGLMTGGGDKPYALGLAACLIGQGVPFDFIGSNELDVPFLHQNPRVKFLNLRGDQDPNVGALTKVWRVVLYYARLNWYAAIAKPKIFHILWNSKFEFVDRVLLMLFYRALGKRVVLTVHNVNARWRDGNDTWLNRLTLRTQYRLAHHLFVHTAKMRQELQVHFAVPERKISLIPFGINSTLPKTALASREARRRFGLTDHEKVILFFGNIAPYKGVEYLIEALRLIAVDSPDYRLIIAGRQKESPEYWQDVQRRIREYRLGSLLIEHIRFIPDEDAEAYFKAADVLVLPYTHVFQSGVLFLSYDFGLPVISTDVGSLRDDIIEGTTGYVCQPKDPVSLAQALRQYFTGDLYRELANRRKSIQDFAHERYSWGRVGAITRKVYEQLA